MRPDIIERGTRAKFGSAAVFWTNGTLITPEMAERLKRRHHGGRDQLEQSDPISMIV